MKSIAANAARIVLGLVFFVFGMNGFLHFIPVQPMGGAAGQFLGGLAASRYLLPLMAGVQALAGLALLARRFVPLALTLLAPIIVNIVAFHLFLEPSGLPLAFFVLGLEIFLAWSYRTAFHPLLQARGRKEAASTTRHLAGNAPIQHAH
jgi:hypothetical protein